MSGGYYTGEYIPYSLAEDGRLLSNVSANIMRFLQDGEQRVYIQLGTVMTDEAHRGQGLRGSLLSAFLRSTRTRTARTFSATLRRWTSTASLALRRCASAATPLKVP